MGNIEIVIDERGRITIPNEERKRLGLYAGTKILLEVDRNKIILKKSPTREDFIKEFCGIIVSEDDKKNLKDIWVNTDE